MNDEGIFTLDLDDATTLPQPWEDIPPLTQHLDIFDFENLLQSSSTHQSKDFDLSHDLFAPFDHVDPFFNGEIFPQTAADEQLWPFTLDDVNHLPEVTLDFEQTICLGDINIASLPPPTSSPPYTSHSPPAKMPPHERPVPTLVPSAQGLDPILTSPDVDVTPLRSKRTYIPPAAKARFESVFCQNPYPSDEIVAGLSRQTQVPPISVRTWFANARSRKTVPVVPLAPSASGTLSPDALETLAQTSPAPSNASLNRYLATSSAEEPVTLPQAVVESNITTRAHVSMGASAMQQSKPINIPRYRRSDSITGSFSSIDSVRSTSSFRSMDPRGPRQGRRGWTESTRNSPPRPRKRLYSPAGTEDTQAPYGSRIRLGTPTATLDVKLDHFLGPVDHEIQGVDRETTHPDPPVLRFPCTWPTCEKRFATRHGWERHEEAVHYNPIHWECCSTVGREIAIGNCPMCTDKDVTIAHLIDEHFSACASRPAEDRTFFRKDHLRQHIRRHISLSTKWFPIPDKLLQAWERDDPALNVSALHCGFCGVICATWKDRSDHVFTHLSQGMCKEAWWPQRLPRTLPADDPSSYTCPACGQVFPDSTTAMLSHAACKSWSCRRLLDFHAMFYPRYAQCESEEVHHGDNHNWKCSSRDCPSQLKMPSVGVVEYHCRLCSWHTTPCTETRNIVASLEEHAHIHNTRGCNQAIFSDYTEFVLHLVVEHMSAQPTDNVPEQSFLLCPWKVHQWLTKRDGEVVAVRVRNPRRDPHSNTIHKDLSRIKSG